MCDALESYFLHLLEAAKAYPAEVPGPESDPVIWVRKTIKLSIRREFRFVGERRNRKPITSELWLSRALGMDVTTEWKPVMTMLSEQLADTLDQTLENLADAHLCQTKHEKGDDESASQYDSVARIAARRRAIIEKVANPDKFMVLRTDEAALYFEVKPRTIHRWVKESKLKRGPRRGVITISSLKSLQRKRSKLSGPAEPI